MVTTFSAGLVAGADNETLSPVLAGKRLCWFAPWVEFSPRPTTPPPLELSPAMDRPKKKGGPFLVPPYVAASTRTCLAVALFHFEVVGYYFDFDIFIDVLCIEIVFVGC